MNARVHRKPAGPPGIEGERTKFLIGIGIEPEFGTQGFGVKRPSFGEGGFLAEAPESRQRAVLHGDRHLHVMARNSFVHREHFAGVGGACLKIG